MTTPEHTPHSELRDEALVMAREIVAIKERGFNTSEYEDVTANTILEMDAELRSLQEQFESARLFLGMIASLQSPAVQELQDLAKTALNSNPAGPQYRKPEGQLETLRAEVDRQLARHICYTEEGSRKRFWQDLDDALSDPASESDG